MKRFSASLLAVLLCVTGATSVWAATRTEHRFGMKFTTAKKNASTGVNFVTNRFAYKPPPLGQPADRVSKITFTMAKGTRTSTAGLPTCTEKKLLSAKGSAACPKGSKVGTGNATIITGVTILDPVKEKVEVFVKKNGLLAYLTGAATAVIPLSMNGNKITTVVPARCVNPSESPNPGCQNGEAVVKVLSVSIKPVGKLIRTPKSCPASRKWTNTAQYVYANGDTETETALSPCKK